jgi:hypothetical protein
MSEEIRFVYQVVAHRIHSENGSALRSRLTNKPFHIGSGASSDMRLEESGILPTHIRLLLTTTGQVMLANLGAAGSVTLDDQSLPAYTPTTWKPGSVAQIANYQLELSAVTLGDDGLVEHVRRAVITQDNNAVSESDFSSTLDEMDFQPPPSNPTVMFPDEQLDDEDEFSPDSTLPDESELPDYDESPREEIPQSTMELGSPFEEEVDGDTELMPFEVAQKNDLAVKMPLPTIDDDDEQLLDTLPKDWQKLGRLSAQLTVNPVIFVPGERVRIPISVRNEYDQKLKVRAHIAGVPRDWITLPEYPLTLKPREVAAFDIIVQTPLQVNVTAVDILIRLSDADAPNAVLALPLQLIFRKESNLIGRLDPHEINDKDHTYLYLQNHTKAATVVFVTGHIELKGVHIIPADSQIKLPPGQTTRIPVSFDVVRRPLLVERQYDFAVSASQGKRAPLDYPGVITVRPRLRLLPLILLTVMALVLALAIILALTNVDDDSASNGDDASTVIETPPTEIPAAINTDPEETEAPVVPVEKTSRPTATDEEPTETPTATASATLAPTNTSTATPSATPTITPSPTETEIGVITTPVTGQQSAVLPSNVNILPVLGGDPRPAGCVVPIPDGWSEYTVKEGERSFQLALQFGTTVDEIARVNCLVNPRMLQVNQVLFLPAP